MISSVMRPALLASALTLALIVATTGAHATLTISAAVGSAPTGADYVNFDNLPLGNAGGASGGLGVSFTSGDGAVVTGSLVNKYAAPYLSNSNGTLFGDSNNGPDTTRYLSTGIGAITLTFPTGHKYLGLLWGSVDDYNGLSFYDGVNLVGSVAGTDVWPSANGNQGVNGTFYANINSDVAFDSVVASSTNYAFEFDNVAYDSDPPANVPEPSTLALFCAGLLGFVRLSRMRRRAART
jgi:hypothetical protein